MTNKKYGVLTSSQNPEEIANKVKGGVLMLSSAVIFLAAKFFGLQIAVSDMTELATVLGALSGAMWAVYGAVLHLIAIFYRVKNQEV